MRIIPIIKQHVDSYTRKRYQRNKIYYCPARWYYREFGKSWLNVISPGDLETEKDLLLNTYSQLLFVEYNSKILNINCLNHLTNVIAHMLPFLLSQ